MKYRCRVFFTDKQKSEIWDRWQRGESMSSIGRGFDRGSSSIYSLLARTGGIRPPERIRSRLALTLTDREEISRGLPERVNDFEIVAFGLQAQVSLRSIARSLKRSTSTISREVRRDGGVKKYRAAASDTAACDRSHWPKPCKQAGNAPFYPATAVPFYSAIDRWGSKGDCEREKKSLWRSWR
jgi:transposase-like protein